MLGCCKRAMASASVRKRARSALLACPPAQDHLEGDEAVQFDLPGLVDDAHAAPAQFPQDLVARHQTSRSRRCRHALGWQGGRSSHGRPGAQRYRFPWLAEGPATGLLRGPWSATGRRRSALASITFLRVVESHSASCRDAREHAIVPGRTATSTLFPKTHENGCSASGSTTAGLKGRTSEPMRMRSWPDGQLCPRQLRPRRRSGKQHGGEPGAVALRRVAKYSAPERCARRLQGTSRKPVCPAHRGDLSAWFSSAQALLPGPLPCLTGCSPSIYQGSVRGSRQGQVSVTNGNHAIAGSNRRIGVTNDEAENAPRLRVTYGEDSQESAPPLTRQVETHTAITQDSSTPVPWRWRSRGARIRGSHRPTQRTACEPR